MAEPSGPTLRPLFRLLGYARPYLWLVGLTLVFSMLYASGLTGRAYLVQPLFDDVIVPEVTLDTLPDLVPDEPSAEQARERELEREALALRVRERFWEILLIAAGIIAGMPLVRLVRDYASDWVMTRMSVDMQLDLSTKLLRIPLTHHQRDKRGEFVSRTLRDTDVANRAQALVFGEAVQDGFQIVVALGFAFYLNWRLALMTILIGPPVGVVVSIFGRRVRRASGRRQMQLAEVTQRLLQILSGIKVIKAFHAEAQEREAYRSELMRYFRRAIKVIRNRVLSRSTVELFSQVGFGVLLILGVYCVINNLWGITIGVLSAFLFVSAMLYRPMRNLTRLYNGVQDALPAAERIFEILDLSEEPADPADAVELDELRECIRYRDVVFSYGREEVLKGVDLEIPAGEIVALVGRTGAGKTTLTDLLLRFYQPTSGSIELDGTPLSRIGGESLRRLIAVVTQEAFLFDATILENLRYGRPDATFDEAVEAARAAHAHEFICDMPEAYDTPVGELGSQLSGGQRQRLTIARALLRDPQILIFDEATSALDAKAEQLVQEATWNLMKGRTVLVIAHRLSTVQSADRIAVLEDGRISMTGCHDELIARGGLYRELVDLQLRARAAAPSSG